MTCEVVWVVENNASIAFSPRGRDEFHRREINRQQIISKRRTFVPNGITNLPWNIFYSHFYYSTKQTRRRGTQTFTSQSNHQTQLWTKKVYLWIKLSCQSRLVSLSLNELCVAVDLHNADKTWFFDSTCKTPRAAWLSPSQVVGNNWGGL